MECLDGLRGLAALWVLAGHCVLFSGWSLPIVDKPDLGVDLFMMLSGFLMVFHYQLRSKKEPWSEPGTWLKFWTRRYFRIAPLYYLLLTLTLVLGPTLWAWHSVADHFVSMVGDRHATNRIRLRILDIGLKNVTSNGQSPPLNLMRRSLECPVLESGNKTANNVSRTL